MKPTNALNFSTILAEAVNQPGSIMEAYSAFSTYSLGNQLLALFQCHHRGLQIGPLDTFKGWQVRGRSVKRGEKALTLCMPISVKRRDRSAASGELETDDIFTTAFVNKPRWFVLSQTEGEEFTLPAFPAWNAEIALAALQITQAPFTSSDGNCQGFAKLREVAINPLAQLPHKTLFHELGHIELAHTVEADFTDDERTPKSLREVEAEAVALLCCEALNLEGAAFCRGYIQSWANGQPIPETSARKILGAADRILKAGIPKKDVMLN